MPKNIIQNFYYLIKDILEFFKRLLFFYLFLINLRNKSIFETIDN